MYPAYIAYIGVRPELPDTTAERLHNHSEPGESTADTIDRLLDELEDRREEGEA